MKKEDIYFQGGFIENDKMEYEATLTFDRNSFVYLH